MNLTPDEFLNLQSGMSAKDVRIAQLDAQLPADFGTWDDVTYIEPFVGGGAMLFYMLQRYPNIRRAVINDVNPQICDPVTIRKDCELLQHVEILTGD